MAPDRSGTRNVWIEFESAPGVVQGGLSAASNLTRREFHDMLNVAFTVDGGFDTRRQSTARLITASNERLTRGTYILVPRMPGQTIRASDARFYHRTLSISTTSEENSFCHQVRHRDRRCVISGKANTPGEIAERLWTLWDAAHIFPLALSHIFEENGFANRVSSSTGIDSPQNGILLRADIHNLWDSYRIAVNPSNSYRVHSFRPSTWEYHGKILHPVCRQPGDPLAVNDALLHWHFEQAVLCNMRGAGEPSFEFDFPPGTDMMGEIRGGPRAAERMEAELFGRLYHYCGGESSPENEGGSPPEHR